MHSCYDIGFDVCGIFSFLDGSENMITFGANMVSLIHICCKKFFILEKGPTDGLDDTTFTTKRDYLIRLTKQQMKFCLNLHYNGVNNHIVANGTEIYIYLKQRILK